MHRLVLALIAALPAFAQADEWAARIHSEVDAYVARAAGPDHFDSKQVQRILGKRSDGTAAVFSCERSLVLVYTVARGTQMGRGATSVSVRAYRERGGRFALADSTGGDMSGYGNVSVRQLNAPVAGEIWLLVWGQMTGANGPNIRMRIYAFDGARFRTVWMPENVWGAFTVRVTDSGFTIDGEYYRENRARHDKYFLSADGVYRSFQ